MGFLDRVMEAVNTVGSKAGGNPALLEGVVDLLKNKGVGGVVQDFKEKGLSDLVSTWVGSGENKLVSPDQIKQALGSEKLQALAQRAGVSPENASKFLTEILPGLVDKLTPGGKVPADDPGAGDVAGDETQGPG